MTDPRRRIPRTDALLAEPRLVKAAEELGRDRVKAAIVTAQQRARAGEIAPEDVVEAALAGVESPTVRRPAGLAPVVNATGVIVHTNLGRAPLSGSALEAVRTAGGYTDVEFDLTDGRRARRGRGALAALADAVPDAGDVHVVNNNAAALLLCALTLAPGREIVLSRGELVEIGDGFRIPELLTSAGTRLREVGTTNRTSVADYAAAIGPDTGCVLKVHPSNFRVTGFAAEASIAELADLGVPVVADIGSGLLRPHPLLPDEPDATTALRAGAAVVTASGDKLLGGPQAGLLLGDTALVERLRRHPAARALRVDKLTLAALEATLRGDVPPVVVALDADVNDLWSRAERLAAELTTRGVAATAVASVAAVGGGGAPGVELPSAAVSLPEHYADLLRAGSPAVVGRLDRRRCLLDLRTVPESDDRRLVEAVMRCTS
ncbi:MULTISPECIES: L-seryl-tRNA(Sec) selenium transferase [Prauserella salsuginis group]|uniref:L-seryl-tRNA(Sec) selenium transferase n=1 Tax=Prauserella salsuginis TaxID=387889 RepID=A0ABW6GAK5_9PSEU|nr:MULTISPECIES: L-seryl-tRNA(Sec) selenium transferase [Prauserella salsuginis group]MCR3722924.1 L-seryl-tRNA(Sec) selenium transferase [Prauserella flava]MCR3737401.1 L-seryl-tRNA(Sec) selenium transferase [Prauserella salsuginis]